MIIFNASMKARAAMLALPLLALGAPAGAAEAPAHAAKVETLFSTALADIPGKEGVMLTVEYPPGGTSSAHRHNAHTFVYVLEGSVVMQVRGGSEQTLTAGQTFYESPSDIHTVSRNASKTQPAKFLVLFIKDKDAPSTLPAK
jgi:quercetin dioxygenase-like cupin family protein